MHTLLFPRYRIWSCIHISLLVEPFVLHDASLKASVPRIHFEKRLFISYEPFNIQVFKNYYNEVHKSYVLFDEFWHMHASLVSYRAFPLPQ